MTPQQRHDKINELVNSGCTVMICTHLKAVQVDREAVRRFDEAGMPLFKVANGSLYMASGKKYVCIDYTTIKAYR